MVTVGAPTLRLPMPGVRELRRYASGLTLVECVHDAGFRLLPGGGERFCCRVCKGTKSTTDGWEWPVKMVVNAVSEDGAQPSLF